MPGDVARDARGRGSGLSLLVAAALVATAPPAAAAARPACHHGRVALAAADRRRLLASGGVDAVRDARRSCATVGVVRAVAVAHGVAGGRAVAEFLTRFSNDPYADRLAWVVVFRRAAPFAASRLGNDWAVFVDARRGNPLQAVSLPPRVSGR